MLTNEQKELRQQLKKNIKHNKECIKRLCKLCCRPFFIHRDWKNIDSKCLCKNCKNERKERYEAKGKLGRCHFSGLVSGGLPSLGKRR